MFPYKTITVMCLYILRLFDIVLHTSLNFNLFYIRFEMNAIFMK